MDREYRITMGYDNNGVYSLTLWKVNIDPRGAIVAEFKGRSTKALFSKATKWMESDVDPHWCYECDRPKNDCACGAV